MKQNSLTDFINEVIVELQQEGRFATANIYKYALRAFTQSVGGGEIFWGGLNRGALHRFQTYLEDLQKSLSLLISVRCVRFTIEQWTVDWWRVNSVCLQT